MQMPEENFFNVVGDEVEGGSSGNMIPIMLLISAALTLLATVCCFLA
jgi:hypothetical protein